MKKVLGLISAVVLSASLAGCGNDKQVDSKQIVVAASPAPHGEVIKHAAVAMKKKDMMWKLRLSTTIKYQISYCKKVMWMLTYSSMYLT